ncbi:MAG TPA: hypothetical protein PKD31_03790, partial [Blastocatellia bacterium]|nr:hypothetical protein [Blastocatellia bacterium]
AMTFAATFEKDRRDVLAEGYFFGWRFGFVVGVRHRQVEYADCRKKQCGGKDRCSFHWFPSKQLLWFEQAMRLRKFTDMFVTWEFLFDCPNQSYIPTYK